MDLNSPLTLIGVIATILACGFGLAAWLNSRRRQFHMSDADAAVKAQHQPPLPHVKQAADALLRQQQAPGQPAPRRGTSVFKQVGPQGTATAKTDLADDNEYIWE